MSFGIELVNDSGGVLLDTSYETIRLFDEGSLTTNSTSTNPGVYSTDFMFAQALPRDEPFLFCIQPGSTWVGHVGLIGDQDASGNLITKGIRVISDAANTFNYKMFTRYGYGSPSISGNHGLQIFAADGSLIYDSRITEGLFLDSFVVPSYDAYSGAPGPASHVSQPSAYYALNLFPNGINTFQASTQTAQWVYKAFRQGSNTSVEFGFISGYGPLVSIQTQPYSSTMMVLDDSNF